MSRQRQIHVNPNPVADRHVKDDERIIEYSSEAGGGLIGFYIHNGRLRVHLYRHDETVEITVGGPES